MLTLGRSFSIDTYQVPSLIATPDAKGMGANFAGQPLLSIKARTIEWHMITIYHLAVKTGDLILLYFFQIIIHSLRVGWRNMMCELP
jgi:hypothetical protein